MFDRPIDVLMRIGWQNGFLLVFLCFWTYDFDIIMWNCLRGFTPHVVRSIYEKFVCVLDKISNLDEVKKLIITNHREGFQKAQLQVVVFLPYFDYKRHDMSYDVVDSEIIR